MDELGVNSCHDLDAIELLKRLGDESVDLILTDPPYGHKITSLEWDKTMSFEWWAEWAKEATRVLSPTAPLIIFAKEPFASKLRLHPALFPLWRYDLVWDKVGSADILNSNHRPMQGHEMILIYSKGGCSPSAQPAMSYYSQDEEGAPYKKLRIGAIDFAKEIRNTLTQNIGTRKRKSVWRHMSLANGHHWLRGLHPTQKPLSIIQDLMLSYSKEGDLVIDPFCGSGTTAIAAHLTNRQFIVTDIGVCTRKHYRGMKWKEVIPILIVGAKKQALLPVDPEMTLF